MILRGTDHALRDDRELMRRVNQFSTIALLKQLQEYYDARARRIEFKEMGAGMSGIERLEFEEFAKVIDHLEQWMRQPVRVNLSGTKKRKLRKVRASRAG